MANADAKITEGNDTFIALYSFTEDAILRHVQRIAHNTSAGLEWTYGAGAVTLGTPRFTHASDDPVVTLLTTQNVYLDGLEGLLTTLGGYLDLVETKLDTIAGSVAGATPAGGNNIGDVDVLSLIPGNGATNLGKAEDAVHASGDTGVMVLGVRQDTQVDFGADGDYVAFSIDANGALRVTGGGGGTEYTEDIAAAADPVGNMLIAVRRDTLSASEVSADGDNIAVKATNKGQVHVFAEILGTQVQSSVAHDAVDSGDPLKIGGKATSSEPAAVASGDRANFITDLVGKHIVLPYANPENFVDGSNASAITDTTSTSVVAAQGAGVRFYATGITITNSHATVGTLVKITDGSGGTLKHQCYCAPVGGGESRTFPTPLKFTTNTAVHAVCGTTGASVYVSLDGYKGI